MTQACLPYLKKGVNPHILTLSPPLNIHPRWFESHVAYTISKYNMSLLTLGWAEEFRKYGIAANTLWPATLIGTAAIENMPGGGELVKMTRKPEIMADAAQIILQKDAKAFSGNFVIDEEILKQHGVTDFIRYNSTPGVNPAPDFFKLDSIFLFDFDLRLVCSTAFQNLTEKLTESLVFVIAL
jgi:citronellol/citronellal dehydrogenase